MKKIVIALVCVLFSCAVLVGTQPTQKIYPIDSEVYQSLTYLYVNQGYALPSTTGPWSADELLLLAQRINRSKLSASVQQVYDRVMDLLHQETPPFDFSLQIATELYAHTNTDDFTRPDDWVRGFVDRKPLLDVSLETWPSPHFYGYSSISLMNNQYNGWDNQTGATSTFFGIHPVTTNIILLPPGQLNDFDFNIPFRAFGAFGGEGWSVQVGRERLSWGAGMSGNFILGDHIHYHNVGKFTAYGTSFKYTLLTSFFPHPSEYYNPSATNGFYIKKGSQDNISSGLFMFLAHRLEWRLFSNRVGLALTEAIVYQSLDNTLDLRVLNPSMIFHNYYIRANANSIIALEVDYTPIPNLNIYGQLVVDEFALPGEPVPGVDNNALPNGFGYMAGVKGFYPMPKGYLHGSFEWVQTDPYLYLRDNGNRAQQLGEYGINFVVALRQFSNGVGVSYTEEFLGYRYGGDAIVLNANVGYKQLAKWSIEANLFYMIHGTHDKWTLWSYVSPTTNVTTPTDTHNNGNNADPNAQDRDAVSKTLVAGISGGYQLLNNLKVYGQADYVHIVNPGNLSTNAPISDVQLTIGLSYSL